MMPPFKSEKDKPFTDWPSVGEVLIDQKGNRKLTVKHVDPKASRGRNVVGVLDNGRDYSCDVVTLLAVWSRLN